MGAEALAREKTLRKPGDVGLSAFESAFGSAAAARPRSLREARYRVGGGLLGTRTIGTHLEAQLGRTLIATDKPGSPTLRLDLWEGRESGVSSPPVPDPDDEIGVRDGAEGEVFALSRDSLRVRYQGPGFSVRLDRAARYAVGWIDSIERLAPWHRSRPLQQLFAPWLADLGMRLLHAAMVVGQGVGVVLPGRTGAGKSTTSLACLNAGFGFLGDDVVSVEIPGESGPIGHCLYTVAKLDRSAMGKFPNLAERAIPYGDPSTDESLVYVAEARQAPSAAIGALAFPHLAETTGTRFAPLSRAQALVALGASLLSVESGRVAQDFRFLGNLVERVPAFRLEIGRDPEGIVAAVERLVDEVRR